jgi:hypothetical protein
VSHLGQRLSALIDGELSHAQRERALAHLARCPPCRQEAAALRALKQRMHALGEATVNSSLTDRLVAMGPRHPGARGVSRRRWPVRSIAAACLAVAGLGLPAAAFLAGGGQQEPGPSVNPQVDVFMLQHEMSTGDYAAATTPPAPAPSPSLGTSRPHRTAGPHRAAGFARAR